MNPHSRRRFLAGSALAASAAGLGLSFPGRLLAAAAVEPPAGPLLTRPIPSSGQRLPVIGAGTSGSYDVAFDSPEYAQLQETVKRFFEGGGSVMMHMREDREVLVVEVADTGIGLPPERDRIVEPYMTTRARGTGLGLAIVKKIVEEHHGTMTFADREGGGTVVRMAFDSAALARLDQGAAAPEPAGEGRLAALTSNRT